MNFSKIFLRFEEIFTEPMMKLAQQRHMLAVRDGMISTIPLTIVGSLFLILVSFPLPEAWKSLAIFQLIARNSEGLSLPFRVTTGLVAIYATYNIGYALAKSYNLDGKSGGTLALMAFFTTTLPQVATKVLSVAQPAILADGSEASVILANELMSLGIILPTNRLGGAGLFTGIFTAILAVEIYHFFVKKNLVIKMPEGVPESVSRSFVALLPAFVIMLVMFILIIVLKFDIQAIFLYILSPLRSIVNSPLGAVAIVFLTCVLWMAGIHGGAIVGTIVRPVWLDMLQSNAEAVIAGNPLPYVNVGPFLSWFVWIGGSGGTLSLVMILLFARSRYLKDLGKVTLIPSLFNINEPIIFGLPVMLNPFFFIPFVFGPIVTVLFSYMVISLGWVNAPFMEAPWTLPSPIGAFMATADWRAPILVVVNFIILMVIYLPFVKMYDKKMYQEELLAQKSEPRQE